MPRMSVCCQHGHGRVKDLGAAEKRAKAFSPGVRLRGQWDGGVCAEIVCCSFLSLDGYGMKIAPLQSLPFVKPVP